MNSDEHIRNSHYNVNRKPGQSKSLGYSPSTNYNYNSNQTQHGNHNSHGNTNYNSGGNKPHHRKTGSGSFKRDNQGSNDKLIKQNDLIIRLLKEIRDRLPEPPETVKEKSPSTPSESTIQQNEANGSDASADVKKRVKKEETIIPAPGNEAPRKPQKENPNDDELDSKVNGNI